jgi:hypothetical protein
MKAPTGFGNYKRKKINAGTDGFWRIRFKMMRRKKKEKRKKKKMIIKKKMKEKEFPTLIRCLCCCYCGIILMDFLWNQISYGK